MLWVLQQEGWYHTGEESGSHRFRAASASSEASGHEARPQANDQGPVLAENPQHKNRALTRGSSRFSSTIFSSPRKNSVIASNTVLIRSCLILVFRSSQFPCA